MKLGGPIPLQQVQVAALLREWLFKLWRAVDGGLGFGDGTFSDNVMGTWATIADTGAANTDFVVTHGLGTVPVGFLVIYPPLTGVVNRGAGAWTNNTMTVRCSAANQSVKIFVLPAVSGVLQS